MSNLIPSGTAPPEEFDFVRWNPKTEAPAGSFTPVNRCDIILNQNPLDIGIEDVSNLMINKICCYKFSINQY